MTFNRKPSAIAAGILLSLASATTAFNAHAEEYDCTKNPPHPILNCMTGATAYRGYFIQALDGAIGAQKGEYLGGGAVVHLEAALKQPSDAPRVVYIPNDPRTGETFVSFVVPPQGLYASAPIPFCVGTAGKEGQIAMSGQITPQAQVVVASQNPAKDATTGNPCRAFINQAKADLAQPPPQDVANAPIPVKLQVLLPRRGG